MPLDDKERAVVEQTPREGVAADQLEALQRRLRELSFLHETSRVLTATLDLNSVLHSLMAQVKEYFRVDAVSVALLDDETGRLVFRVAVGEAADKVVGVSLSPGQGIAGWVVEKGEPAVVPAVHADGRFYGGVDDATGFHTRVMLAVPIRLEGRPIGVIEAINPTSGAFDADAQRVLLAVADLAAVAIHNARLYERVRQAERRYESLFEEGVNPIVVLDLEGRVQDLNQRALELFGCPREQILGADLADMLQVQPDVYRAALQQAGEGRQSSLLAQIARGDVWRTIEVHMTRIDYGGRSVIQWVGYDISERVALEHMREDLTHMIIHDLRNPLGSIMSSLQLIHTAYVERDATLPIAKLLRIAMRSGQKLYQLIDSLLDIGRLEAGEAELNKTLLQPDALVQEAVEQIHPLVLNKRQQLSVAVAPGLPALYADRDLTLRVLINLLDNAVKFTPEGGRIALGVERAENGVLFTVLDTGQGIQPEHQQRIFDRFTRLSNVEKGTGLGLAFCKLAVEAHGGRIWVESAAGRGSQFKFVLPVGTTGEAA